MLPVAIFHALGTASYTGKTAAIIGIFLVVILLSFAAGFLIRLLFREPYCKYIPFLMSVYEGGMIGYPLYTSLCGAENLSRIALLDVACLLFGFSVYMGLLQQAETGERFQVRPLLLGAIKNPSFIATILGILVGATGAISMLRQTSFWEVYSATQSIITSGLSALVLIAIGFEFSLTSHLLLPCLKTIACRVILQALLVVAVIAVMHVFFGPDRLLDIALIMLMASPAPFSMQSYLKIENGGSFVSSVNSLYCIITIVVYIMLACFLM